MAFLRLQDYYETIPQEHLETILEQSTGIVGDIDVLEASESKSITRAKEYLTSRYKVDLIFKPFKEFDLATSYSYGDRINYTADLWEASVYLDGELVIYNGIVYLRNAVTASYTAATLPTNATFFSNKGEAGIYYIAFPSEYDIDTIYATNDLFTFSHEIYKKNTQTYVADQLPLKARDTAYFARVRTTAYLTEKTVTGVYPTNSEWTFGDNRNQSMVECIVAMTINKIHSIINPRNIPALRRDNYSMSIEMLKEYQGGLVQVDLPDREIEGEQTGHAIRFGSNEPTNHSY